MNNKGFIIIKQSRKIPAGINFLINKQVFQSQFGVSDFKFRVNYQDVFQLLTLNF